jgi:hypothetical protein
MFILIWEGEMDFPSKSIKFIAIVFFLLASLVFSDTYYVKPDGDDATTGTNWQSAFKTITKALNIAKAEDGIWVKEGTYQEGKTITILEGISMYGGFAGTESSLEQRNFSNYPTIIDGEGTYRCVLNYGTIDGFQISNGNSDNANGGGINNYKGIVTNCIISSNTSVYRGGGIYNKDGKVINCIIYSNSAGGGGGIENSGIVTNCILYSNTAVSYGGGIYNDKGTITNCTLYNNSADEWAGGIFNFYGTITNCIS